MQNSYACSFHVRKETQQDSKQVTKRLCAMSAATTTACLKQSPFFFVCWVWICTWCHVLPLNLETFLTAVILNTFSNFQADISNKNKITRNLVDLQ